MFTLPELPYKYDALEPMIDEETMRIHHTKHHQSYIDKLNQALTVKPDLATKNIEDLLSNLQDLPSEVQLAVRNHGGGHANHCLFWQILQPSQDNNLPTGISADLIARDFVDFSTFKKDFTETALSVFGSGWVWLAQTQNGQLKILKTSNQDSPLTDGLKPVLALDVWEHAYYLKYQNRRIDYVDSFFNLINWQKVSQILDENKN